MVINIPLISLIVQGIPELVAEVTLAFVIAGIPLKWKRILMIGIILASISYIVRLFFLPFGIHTILLIILLFIALILQGKGDISLYLIASILSFLTLAILEFVCLSLFMPILGVTPETLFNNLETAIILTEPQVILLFILAFLLNKFIRIRGTCKDELFRKY